MPVNHTFEETSFAKPTWCDVCSKFIWGLTKQGYRCADCKLECHKKCSKKVNQSCEEWRSNKRPENKKDHTVIEALELEEKGKRGFKREQDDVPLIVRETVAYIREKGLFLEGIFRVSASADKVKKIKALYDKGKKVDLDAVGDAHTVAGVLKEFLREPEESLLTFELYDAFIAAIVIEDDKTRLKCLKKTLLMLPPGNMAIVRELCSLLFDVQARSHKNKMNAHNLGVVFAPTLMKKHNETALDIVQNVNNTMNLVSTMILNYKWLLYHLAGDRPPFLLPRKDIVVETDDDVRCIRYVPSQQVICCGFANGLVDVMNSDKGEYVTTLGAVDKCNAALCNVFEYLSKNNTQLLVCVHANGHIALWNIGDWSLRFAADGRHQAAVHASLLHQCELWTADEGGLLIVWDIEQERIVREKPLGVPITEILLCDNHLWVGSKGFLYVLDGISLEPICTLKEAHPMHASVTKLVHIPSLNQVWSAADDGSICVWNGKAYQLQRNIPEAHSGKIIELIAIGNEFVLSGSVDQRIRLWDSISGACKEDLEEAHNDQICGFAFLENDLTLWSVSRDRHLKQWKYTQLLKDKRVGVRRVARKSTPGSKEFWTQTLKAGTIRMARNCMQDRLRLIDVNEAARRHNVASTRVTPDMLDDLYQPPASHAPPSKPLPAVPTSKALPLPPVRKMLRQQSRLWGDLGCIEGLSEEQEEEEDVVDKGDDQQAEDFANSVLNDSGLNFNTLNKRITLYLDDMRKKNQIQRSSSWGKIAEVFEKKIPEPCRAPARKKPPSHKAGPGGPRPGHGSPGYTPGDKTLNQPRPVAKSKPKPPPRTLVHQPPADPQNTCSKCNKPITHGSIIRAMQRRWHEECFVCARCGAGFPDDVFNSRGGRPYCDSCWLRQARTQSREHNVQVTS